MKWFTDYAEAQAYENQELHKKIKAKLQRNGLVILTRDQWKDYEQAEVAANTGQTALSQVAD